MKIALIDADILVYRVGFATEQEDEEVLVRNTVRSTITDMLLKLEGVEDYLCFLSGASEDNFRHQYAITQPYKGNRKGNRPRHYDTIRQYLIDTFEATVSVGQEADDDIAIKATELGDSAIICSIDKDFYQIPTTHYSFVKGELFTLTPEQSLLAFYSQFLEGDRIDNIQGARGWGKVKTKALLEGKTETEMFKEIVDILGYDRAVENGRLLYLRRKAGEIWEPPTNE